MNSLFSLFTPLWFSLTPAVPTSPPPSIACDHSCYQPVDQQVRQAAAPPTEHPALITGRMRSSQRILKKFVFFTVSLLMKTFTVIYDVNYYTNGAVLRMWAQSSSAVAWMFSGVLSCADTKTQSQTTAYNLKTALSAASGNEKTAICGLHAVVSFHVLVSVHERTPLNILQVSHLLKRAFIVFLMDYQRTFQYPCTSIVWS